MSVSKGGQRSTQSGGQSVDPTTTAYLQQIMDAAKASGAAGPSSLVTGATGYNSSAMGAGQTGMNALSGDPKATAQLMNPYIQQVMNANNAQLANTDAIGTQNVNSAASMSGAFGGSRQGVAQGTMLSQNALNNNQMNAGLLSSGYGQAMNQASQLAGMGFNAAGNNANLGMGGVGSPQQWMLQQLKNGFVMPTGSTYHGAQAGVQAGVQGNPLQMLASMFGGGGG